MVFSCPVSKYLFTIFGCTYFSLAGQIKSAFCVGALLATLLNEMLLAFTVDLVSWELYRQSRFGFDTSPRQAFASLAWNFLSRIWHSRLSFLSHFLKTTFEHCLQSMSSSSARHFYATSAFYFQLSSLFLPTNFKVKISLWVWRVSTRFKLCRLHLLTYKRFRQILWFFSGFGCNYS